MKDEGVKENDDISSLNPGEYFPLECLSGDLCVLIFQHLDIPELNAMEVTCQHLRKLFQRYSARIWKTAIGNYLPGVSSSTYIVSNLDPEQEWNQPGLPLRLAVPGGVRNLIPESPRGSCLPSLTLFNHVKGLAQMLYRIRSRLDSAVHTILTSDTEVLQENPDFRNPTIMEIIELEERLDVILPVDYVYFLVNHVNRFWWHPSLEVTANSGAPNYLFLGPVSKDTCESTLALMQLLDSGDYQELPGTLMDINDNRFFQARFWSHEAEAGRDLMNLMSWQDGSDLSSYLAMELTDPNESDFGAIYYLDPTESFFDFSTPLWSYFSCTDYLLRIAQVAKRFGIAPWDFMSSTGPNPKFRRFLGGDECLDEPPADESSDGEQDEDYDVFKTNPSVLYVPHLPISLDSSVEEMESSRIYKKRKTLGDFPLSDDSEE
ncbi:hypothetical protein K7432_011986 [Basidiobolus ranarum]|uniref:F-box domain-containing protein n=1 Tax=Basidiobolus ranarum TaxID=34480 RepID=A0ABR2VTJ4_9FUNG